MNKPLASVPDNGVLPTWEALLFFALIAIYLAPIWVLPYFPSQDGPIHLYMAQVLADYDNPAYSLVKEYFQVRFEWNRNAFTSVVLLFLFKFFPMLVAEKIYLSIFIVFFPLAVAYAARALRRDTLAPAFFAFPFILAWMLIGGLYAFAMSNIPLFLALGYWLRIQDRYTPMRIGTLAVLCFATYLVHIFAAQELILIVGVATLWLVGRDVVVTSTGAPSRSKVWMRAWTAVRRKGLPPFLAVLPVIVLILAFVTDQGIHQPRGVEWLSRMTSLLLLLPLNALATTDLYFSVPINTMLILLLILGVGRWRQEDLSKRPVTGALLAVVVFYVLTYPFIPSQVGANTNIEVRHATYVFLAIILWLAAHPLSSRTLRRYGLAVAVIAVLFAGYRQYQFTRLNDYMAEYLSAFDLVAANTTVLPISLAPVTRAGSDVPLAQPNDVFLHLGALVAARRHAVYLKLFQAATASFYPLVYWPERNPYRMLTSRLDQAPPSGLHFAYPQGGGGRIDYVMLWDPVGQAAENPEARSILARLEAGYDLVFVSPQRGLARLYRRRD